MQRVADMTAVKGAIARILGLSESQSNQPWTWGFDHDQIGQWLTPYPYDWNDPRQAFCLLPHPFPS